MNVRRLGFAVSFAVAAGLLRAAETPADLFHPYTLVSRVASLQEAGEKIDPSLLFDASRAAGWMKNGAKRRDFLMQLCKADGVPPAIRRKALRAAAWTGAPVDAFKEFAELEGGTLDAFYSGLQLLSSYAYDLRFGDYQELARFLLDTWPSPREQNAVMLQLHHLTHNANILGLADGRVLSDILKGAKRLTYTFGLEDLLESAFGRRVDDKIDLPALYARYPDFPWSAAFFERTAERVSDAKAPDVVRRYLKVYGAKKDRPDEAIGRFRRKLDKTKSYGAIQKEVRSGAYPGAAPGHKRRHFMQVNTWNWLIAEVREGVFGKKDLGKAMAALGAWAKGDLQTFHFGSPATLIPGGNVLVAALKKDRSLAKDIPFALFERLVFENVCTGYDQGDVQWLLTLYNLAGRTADGFAAVERAMAAFGEAWEMKSRLWAMVVQANTVPAMQWDAKSRKATRPSPQHDSLAFLRKHLPAFKKARGLRVLVLPRTTGCDDNLLWTLLRLSDPKAPDRRDLSPEEQSFVDDAEFVRRELPAMYAECSILGFGNGPVQAPISDRFRWQGERDTLPAEFPDVLSGMLNTRSFGHHAALQASLRKMMALGRCEIVYLVVSVHPDTAKIADFQKLRAEAAAKMPGLYPVDEKDPAYPLYVAADALQNNNPERAWSLLSANLKVFDADPMRFQPQFVLWALEQYRKVRGEDDALRDKAWEHVDALLAKESSLPADIVAGLFLLRAEIAEDRMNYEVAHAGYLQLRNHATYRKTDAGRQAMFKDVDLMMKTGNLDGAAQTAEQWIATPEPDVRAQGHFVLAKIAFLQKNYEDVRKELDKVFEIDLTHAEGRLLQGEWKLATNYEVDDTQVLLGDLRDRSAIRPGQSLSISVQDKILSVAGGGASIPVLVTTSSGRDREKVSLYPGTRDPSLFRGSIDTVLGVAKAGNASLELSGDDVIAYQIDPDFLKARGLKPDEPKKLRVVDDAQLEIGSGQGEGDNRRVNNLRPGLPLRIKVIDRDRARASGPQTVTVSVATTSGDALKAAKLVETGVDTGVFTAEIPTAIPPPRAFASDSTVGFGPEDLISSTRSGAWQSATDRKKPKSVGVDTMTSHLVSEARIDLKNPESVTAINLWGRLYGEEVFLGSFPNRDPETRAGIRRFVSAGNFRNRDDFVRSLLQTKGAASEKADAWRVRKEWKEPARRHVLLRGFFCVAQDELLTLRLKPLAPENASDKDDRRLRYLHAEVRIDGKMLLFCAPHQDGYRKKARLELSSGVHELEVYALLDNPVNDFELSLVTEEGELVPVPADWTDASRHPELKARINDRCSIVRSGAGFKASFAEPQRLRAVRWEFSDFMGRGVSATKLHLVDKTGAEVIPSARDYTEALGNATLEVAPGDRISVQYEDRITSDGRERTLERTLRSTFHDGRIDLFCEQVVDVNGLAHILLHQAYRVAPGDTVVAQVTDPDLDVSSGADSVKLTVTTDSGDVYTVKAEEETRTERDGSTSVAYPGRFTARVRTAPPPAEGQTLRPGLIPLKPGDGITVSYVDEDNTSPGVPVPRKKRVAPVSKDATVTLSLAHTWCETGIDKSPEAEQKLRRIRRRSESSSASHVWRRQNCASWSGARPAVVVPGSVLPFVIQAPAFARHAGSCVTVRVATKSELEAAAAEGRDPEWTRLGVKLGGSAGPVKIVPIKGGVAMPRANKLPDLFFGSIKLYSSQTEEKSASSDEDETDDSIDLKVGDELVVRIVGKDDAVLVERTARIGSTGWIGLVDSTYVACNDTVHLGETLHLMVVDPDRDTTGEQDEIAVEAVAKSGEKRTLVLRETMARSGVFTCPVTPSLVLPPPADGVATNAAAEASVPTDATAFPAAYGDEIVFTYADDDAGPEGTPGARSATAKVLSGSDGAVRSYSKRFRNADQAVLVQFRLAECLFEMSKDYRKLKDARKSAEAIAEGRRILEAALRDFPNSSHAAEGEFLLANLYEQLAEEERQAREQREKDGEDLSQEPDKAAPLYREAVARFSSILSAWPEGEYAARSQYHKALCLERLEDFSRASEEYVKMTYLFPESPLVGDASVRLASYYYRREQRYDIAGKIYTSFRNRFPAHPQAAQALFMGGQCHVKRAETLAAEEAEGGPKARGKNSALIADAYRDAVASFVSLVENYKDGANKDLLAQGLYWAGDCSFRLKDYANAYIYLKRTTFEYPESKWARYARGMLLQESKAFEEVAE